MRFRDRTGEVFERLTVVRREYPNHKNGRIRWLCQCKCGNSIIVVGHNLVNEDTKSCGCLKLERQSKPIGVAARNRIIRYYKKNAETRNLPWAVSSEKFESIIFSECFYCGTAPATTMKDTKHHLTYNGIDRLDNTQGYLDTNVVPCCHICNHAKSDLSLEAFLQWIGKIYCHSRKYQQTAA